MRRGFTLIELLVTLAVIALLLAVLLPAVQSVREQMRRTDCSSRMRQLLLATANYESNYGYYPQGVTYRKELLPYIDQANLAAIVSQVNGPLEFASDSPVLKQIRGSRIPLYLCPSDSPQNLSGNGPANYVGNSGTGLQVAGYNGFFVYDYGGHSPYGPGWLRPADFANGLSNIAAFSEVRANNGTLERLRVIWHFKREMNTPDQFETFKRMCYELPDRPDLAGVIAQGYIGHGAPWFSTGGSGYTFYNHVLPPNTPACKAGDLHSGIYPPSSLHPGGVNMVFGDGHVQFISNDVDGKVWRGYGARAALSP